MAARIYQRPKNAMQSGKARTGDWVLEFEQSEARRADPEWRLQIADRQHAAPAISGGGGRGHAPQPRDDPPHRIAFHPWPGDEFAPRRHDRAKAGRGDMAARPGIIPHAGAECPRDHGGGAIEAVQRGHPASVPAAMRLVQHLPHSCANPPGAMDSSGTRR